MKDLTGTWLAERCLGADGKLPSFSEYLRTLDIEHTFSVRKVRKVRNVEVEGCKGERKHRMDGEVFFSRVLRLGDRVGLLATHDGHLMLFVNDQLTYLVSCPSDLLRKKSACDNTTIWSNINLCHQQNFDSIKNSHATRHAPLSRYCEIPWANNPPMHALIDLDGSEPWNSNLRKYEIPMFIWYVKDVSTKYVILPTCSDFVNL